MTRIFVGSIKAIKNTGTPSGIYKEEVRSPIFCSLQGLQGDRQADLSVHGGPDKAVHCYPSQHYPELERFFPEIALQLHPGAMGENLSTCELNENDIHIGDVWQVGEAQLEVTQPRQPCWKIDAKFEATGLTAFIAEQLLTGWYFRVVQPGVICPDDTWSKVKSGFCLFSLREVQEICRQHRPNIEHLEHICHSPGISLRWQNHLQDRLHWLKTHARAG